MRTACFVLLAWATTVEAAEISVEAEARLLSRYPAGRMPVDPEVMTAIDALAQYGSDDDLSLLRSIATHERAEVEQAANRAISHIRGRERERRRVAFAEQVPERTEWERASRSYRASGFGAEESNCVAYVSLVLTEKTTTEAWSLEEALSQAAVNEDRGDIPLALQQYALLAAHNDTEAWTTLRAYGVDPERLLLGMLTHPTAAKPSPNEAAILEVLVRRGGTLTITVLNERAHHTAPSERVVAVDALERLREEQGWAALQPQ